MSIIEVFWGQARILVEFFTGALASTTTSAAEQFTKKRLRYGFAFGDKDVVEMMNDQIAHMNNARTTDPNAKLRPDDMWRVGAAIGRAFNLFEENLRDDARKVWAARITGRQPIDAGNVYVFGTAQACTPGPKTAAESFNYLGGPTGAGGPAR
jgi:hypothetical protein